MPSLDFDEIARAILGNDDPELLGDLLEGMRQVWNARGAADIAAIEADWKQQNEVYGDSTLLSVIKAVDR